MRSRLIKRYAASFTALALAAALLPAAVADDSLVISAAELGRMSGAEIYSHICQGCHMPEGQGAVGAGHYPKLASDAALVSGKFAAIVVLGGRNGMPAFGAPPAQAQQTRSVNLSDAQIADVVNYVRSHFGNRYKGVVSASDVAALPHPGVDAP
jgi:mono/diheme cytochrome c family protein